MTTKRTPAQIATAIAAEPYAWPGGYERWALTDDGGELCHRCCAKHAVGIAESLPGDGWHVVGEFCACDVDEPSYCDSCSALLLPSGMSEDDYRKTR